MYHGLGMQGEAKAMGPCLRDLEYEARQLKKMMDANKAFVEGLERFVQAGSFSQVPEKDTKTLFAIYGALKLELPKQERHYNDILDLMEEEKKDGN